MDVRRTDIAATKLQSLAWDGDALVDWVGGARYGLDGTREELNVGYPYRFDAAVGLGPLGLAFEALGTKGRLLRDNGERAKANWIPMSMDAVREIDRSYYHAEDYFYPIALFRLPDGRPAIAHCPRGYNILDIEELNGACLTPRSARDSEDIFHSRLDASLDGKWLLSNGWVWQPWRVVCVYDVERALAEPAYLSTVGEKISHGDAWEWEMDGAAFVGPRIVCVTNGEKNALTVYDLDSRRHEALVELTEPPGSRLMAAGEDHIVLFDGTPRLLQLSTGNVVQRWNDLDGGKGLWQPSVNMEPPAPPWLAADPANARFALGWPNAIAVISLTF
jgi:hypothetical protein